MYMYSDVIMRTTGCSGRGENATLISVYFEGIWWKRPRARKWAKRTPPSSLPSGAPFYVARQLRHRASNWFGVVSVVFPNGAEGLRAAQPHT